MVPALLLLLLTQPPSSPRLDGIQPWIERAPGRSEADALQLSSIRRAFLESPADQFLTVIEDGGLRFLPFGGKVPAQLPLTYARSGGPRRVDYIFPEEGDQISLVNHPPRANGPGKNALVLLWSFDSASSTYLAVTLDGAAYSISARDALRVLARGAAPATTWPPPLEDTALTFEQAYALGEANQLPAATMKAISSAIAAASRCSDTRWEKANQEIEKARLANLTAQTRKNRIDHLEETTFAEVEQVCAPLAAKLFAALQAAERAHGEARKQLYLALRPELEQRTAGLSLQIRKVRLGLKLQTMTPELAKSKPVGTLSYGALIEAVMPDGPGAKIGLRVNDVVTRLDDKPIVKAEDVTEALRYVAGGQPISIEIVRNGFSTSGKIIAEPVPPAN